MISTPYLIMAGIVLFTLWWTGRLGGLFRSSRPAIQRMTVSTVTPPTNSVQAILDNLDSATLGLAFQRAVRREADNEIAVTLAAKNRAEAVKAYLDPFSSGGPPLP